MYKIYTRMIILRDLGVCYWWHEMGHAQMPSAESEEGQL